MWIRMYFKDRINSCQISCLCTRKTGVKSDSVLGLSTWKNRVAVNCDGRGCRQIKFGEAIHEFHFGHPEFGDTEQTVGNMGPEFTEEVWARDINVSHGFIDGI